MSQEPPRPDEQIPGEELEDRPPFSLLSGEEDFLALFTALAGREPTAEELADLRQALGDGEDDRPGLRCLPDPLRFTLWNRVEMEGIRPRERGASMGHP
jgi:hypothetical protein